MLVARSVAHFLQSSPGRGLVDQSPAGPGMDRIVNDLAVHLLPVQITQGSNLVESGWMGGELHGIVSFDTRLTSPIGNAKAKSEDPTGWL